MKSEKEVVEIIKKLKNIKAIDKQSKSLYTFAAAILKNIVDDKDFQQICVTVNVKKKTLQGYFNKYYTQKTEEEKSVIKRRNSEANKGRAQYYRDNQRKKTILFQMYNNGELSKKSTEKISEVLLNITNERNK